jgi:hypothetical protein
MAWRSRSAAVEPEPAPLADMVVLLAERFGSRGMASVERVGMALLDLCAIWRGLGLGRAAGDTGYAVFERSSAGRSTCTLDRAGNSNDDPESRDGDIIGAKKISSSGWLRRRAWKAGSPKRPQQQRLRMRMRMRMR